MATNIKAIECSKFAIVVLYRGLLLLLAIIYFEGSLVLGNQGIRQGGSKPSVKASPGAG